MEAISVNHYRLILPQYAAMVLSFHMSHSDIAFVVKFKFSEGLSEIFGGSGAKPGPPPPLPPPAAAR